jgi:hypothetical protein
MNLKQWLGLECKHKQLSIPVNRRRHCLDCGEEGFVFDIFDLNEQDRKEIDHHQLHERSINRISKRLLRWRKSK